MKKFNCYLDDIVDDAIDIGAGCFGFVISMLWLCILIVVLIGLIQWVF